MIGKSANAPSGVVNVVTTDNRGLSPEELAEMALNKIIYVGNDLPEPVRIQALSYQEQIKLILVKYLKQAVTSDRATLAGELERQGHADMANIVRSL